MKSLFLILVSVIVYGCVGGGDLYFYSYDVVDTVWTVEPGTPYTHQFDKIHYGKTKGGQIISKRNSIIRKGDTVKFYQRTKQ